MSVEPAPSSADQEVQRINSSLSRTNSADLRSNLRARKAAVQLQLERQSNTHLKKRELKDEEELGYTIAWLESCRKQVEAVLSQPLFDLFIVLLVLLNCVAVTMQTPNPPTDYVRTSTVLGQ